MFSSIRRKMMAAFAAVLLIVALNSIWAISNFRSLQKDIEDIMQSNYYSVVAAQHMMVALERQDSAQLSYLFTASQESTQNHRMQEQEFISWYTRAKDNITESTEPALIENIESLYNEYILSFDELVRTHEYEGSSHARQYYYQVTFPLFEKIKDECRALLELNQEAMVNLQSKAERRASRAILTTSIISAIAILSGITLAFYLSGQVSNPIQALIQKMKRISEGDYHQEIAIKGDDEISVLAKEFNTMAHKLKRYETLNISNIMMEKQKAEAIVESISDGVIVTDQEHRIILVNRAAERFFEIKEKEVLNKHFLEVIKRDDLFQLIDNISKQPMVDSRKKYTDFTVQQDNEVQHCRVNITPIVGRSGGKIGIISLIQDITKLVEVNDLKSEFVSTVSHEFRTPLTSMVMAIGLLKDDIVKGENEDQKELIAALEEDADRLTDLVTELLDLSRIESGKVDMNFEASNIDELIDGAIRPIKMQFQQFNISYVQSAGEHLSPVKADPSKIAWVINNLVSNAIRYVPHDGSGKIEISARESMNRMLITVSDNGIGIPEEYQKVIFDKFVQVSEQNDIGGGAGLGLAICKEIVKAHGGEIWVESEQGKGSIFFFTLKINT